MKMTQLKRRKYKTQIS